MYRAVFFDVGNTLLYPYPSVSHVVREVLKGEGHAHDLAAIETLMPLVDQFYEDRYREDDTFWTNEDETSSVWVGMYSLLCRRLGIDMDAERIARHVYDEFGDPSRWRPYDDVVPAFERLRARGIRIGLISNWDRRLAGIFTGLGIGHMIDVVISSAEVGLRKPDPRIFEMALERLAMKASESVHIGDHLYADVLGAQAAGMTPLLIDRHGGEDPGTTGFLRSLDEMDGFLGLDDR